MNIHLLKDTLGWVATVAFASSYLCKSQSALRRTQAMAALLWIAYGVATGALPVIATNVATAFMAVAYPWIRRRAERSRPQEVPVAEPPKQSLYDQMADLA